MRTLKPHAGNVLLLLAWFLGGLSAAANATIVVYVLWTLTLGGHSYAQSDLGLFWLLTLVGTPVLVGCGSMLILGAAIRTPAIRISLRKTTPLASLLIGNVSVVVLAWLYLLLMP